MRDVWVISSHTHEQSGGFTWHQMSTRTVGDAIALFQAEVVNTSKEADVRLLAVRILELELYSHREDVTAYLEDHIDDLETHWVAIAEHKALRWSPTQDKFGGHRDEERLRFILLTRKARDLWSDTFPFHDNPEYLRGQVELIRNSTQWGSNPPTKGEIHDYIAWLPLS